MSLAFLLALALLFFLMKLVVILLPASRTRTDWNFILSPLVSPSSFGRQRPLSETSRVILRGIALLPVLALACTGYWALVAATKPPELLLGYLAAPILLLAGECFSVAVALLWRPTGQLLPPVHHHPLRSRSLADFWGRRWNLWFSDWFRYALLARLRRHPVLALVLVFAVSGLMHEWVINLPLWAITGRNLFGTMMAYFPIQGAGMILERRFLAGAPRTRVVFAWLVILVPAPLILNEGLLRALLLWPE